MLSYHDKTGLKEIKVAPFPAARVGTYIRESLWSFGDDVWKLRVKRRTKGSTWKQVTKAELPKKLLMEALLLGIQL
jgi:hypothetical protein